VIKHASRTASLAANFLELVGELAADGQRQWRFTAKDAWGDEALRALDVLV
jgi:hypothetical protein